LLSGLLSAGRCPETQAGKLVSIYSLNIPRFIH
jgi:hypothetical protein